MKVRGCQMRRQRYMMVLIIFILMFAGCQVNESNSEEVNSDEMDQLMIYTTIYPLEFLTEAIGGEYVKAESILPAGSDAHSFEPTSRMMVEIAEADLFIYNDDVSETYAVKIKEALSDENVAYLEASAGLDRISYHHDHAHDEDDHHDHGDYDPHVWLSPRLMEDLAEEILTELIELAPEQAAYFEANYDQIVEQLTELDSEFTEVVEAGIKDKILVTHAAFGYWEHDYGLEQIAITGLSATQEPSQRELAYLIETVRELDIEYILFEQNIQPRVAEVIQEEAGLTDLQIHNLEVLTEEDIKSGEDYFSIMEKNIDVLREALN